MHKRSRVSRCVLVIAMAAIMLAPGPVTVHAQSSADFVPVTDAMLQNPAPADWRLGVNVCLDARMTGGRISSLTNGTPSTSRPSSVGLGRRASSLSR